MKTAAWISLALVLIPSSAYPRAGLDKVFGECRKIFDSKLRGNTDAILNPGCTSKSGTNVGYKTALNLYDLGVMGSCGTMLPTEQALLDAKRILHVEKESPADATIRQCHGQVEKGEERIFGDLSECVNKEVANGMYMVGKNCGEELGRALNAEDYKTTFKSICVAETRKGKAECERISNKAYLSFLKAGASGAPTG